MQQQHDPALVEELARYFLRKAYENGDPPFDDEAWLAGGMKQLVQRNTPQEIERKVAHLRAVATGKRITCCREVRGSHGMSYDFDPVGTDPPPPWWNRDEAKREYDGRRA